MLHYTSLHYTTLGRERALLPGLALSAASMATAAAGAPVGLAVPLVCGGWAVGSSLVGSVPSAIALDASAKYGGGQQGQAQLMGLSRAFGDAGMIAGCVASGSLLGTLGPEGAFGVQAGLLACATVGAFAALRRPKGG